MSEVVRVSRNETRQRKISLVSLMIQRVASYESHEDKASMSFYKDELNGLGVADGLEHHSELDSQNGV